ncbi:MAG: substrate-binding domain-containing protein [Sulfurimonas sp.]|nr:substrate-binding domain-containing protein [Sulfurimonas sp.]
MNRVSFFTLLIIMLTMFSSCSENRETKNTEVVKKETKVVSPKTQTKKKIAYIVTDSRIPFWAIMGRGVQSGADSLGYELEIYSAENSTKKELELSVKAIKDEVSGIIVSPSTSSACVTILKLAKGANIPVVISDIGTDGGEYVSYISSNNREGAYEIGKLLAKKMADLGWNNGRVGIVAIPQKRLNGQARTAGFMQAMDEANIKGADIKQLVTWSEEETYTFCKEMIESYPDLRAIWLQTSNGYNGALRAITESGKKNELLLMAFDAEPEFLDLIPTGVLAGSAMQQPYLMGQEAIKAMDLYLSGKDVPKSIQLPILPISTENIAEKLPIIKRDVLGI